jgi:hypothetical protein
MQRRRVAILLASAIIGGATALRAASNGDQEEPCQAHMDWLTGVLNRMGTVGPGSTRKALLEVFTTEGGLSTGLQRTYVSRDCPYLKVDVEFEAVGRPDRDEDGRVTLVEDDQDIIVKISPPYLGGSVKD